MGQLDDDLDAAYTESGETWHINDVDGTSFLIISRVAGSEVDFDVRAQKTTIQDREIRWRISENTSKGLSIDNRTRLFNAYTGDYWLVNGKPQTLEPEFVAQVRIVKKSTAGADQ